MSNEDLIVNGEVNAVEEEDALKSEARRFSTAVNNSSLRIHGTAYTSLIKFLERSTPGDIPEQFIKGFIKLSVSSSIRRYVQPRSFLHVAKLIVSLAKIDFNSTIVTLAQVVQALLPIVTNLSDSSAFSQIPTSKYLLLLLSSEKVENLSEEEQTVVVSALATLFYYTCGNSKAEKIIQKKLKNVLKTNPELSKIIEDKATVLLKEYPEKTSVLIAAISNATSHAVLPSLFIDALSKTVLLSKYRPADFLINGISGSFQFLNEKNFNDILLPNIKKALLRSPEVAVYGVLSIVQNVSFSLDNVSLEILKTITALFQSTDESLQDAAIDIAVFITKKAQLAVITKVVNALFDQITVSKIAETRIKLFNGIAKISIVTERNDLDKIGDEIILKTTTSHKDTHEGTVEAQWHAATKWAEKLSKITPALIGAFKESTKLHPSVKHIAYRALSEILEKRELMLLPEGVDGKSFLTEIDIGPKGELSSIGLALILLTTNRRGSAEHTTSWNRAANAESLFKEKSLSTLKWQDGVAWAKLVEKIILEKPSSEKSFPISTLRGFSLLLFWPHWKVRQQATKSLLRVLEKEKTQFAEQLADFIYLETTNGNIDNQLKKVAQNSEWNVPGEWYVQTLRVLLIPSGEKLDNLAIHTLLLASIKRLVEVDGSVWLRWIHENRVSKTWKTDENFRETAIERVLKCEHREIRDTALITLVALNDEQLKNELWKHVEAGVKEIDVKSYNSLSDKDVSIFKTEEGQLFNTSVIDFDEAAGIKAQKGSREEQLAEIQLIRELAEKRRKEGKLTLKQKQVMEKELASEKEIRDNLRVLFNIAESKLDQARALVNADHAGAFTRYSILYDYCLPLLKSKLVYEQAASLFLAYRSASFEHSDDYLEELVGSCWLRVVGSPYKIPGWSEENIDSALKRMFSLLNERSFIVDTGDDDQDDEPLFDDEIVGAAQLTLLFPMINVILTNDRYLGQSHSDALQLLQNAIHKKFLRDNEVLNLPMENYASLLFEYYAKRLNQSAFKGVQQLFRLVNNTNDVGDRVIGMVREILSYLVHEKIDVRIAALEILSAPQLLMRIAVECGIEASITKEVYVRVFVARFDPIEQVADRAEKLWNDNHFQIKTVIGLPLVDECVSPNPLARDSASRALHHFIENHPDEMNSVLDKFKEIYHDLVIVRGAIFDDVGRLQQDAVDEWERRTGIGNSLVLLATIVRQEEAEKLIKVAVPDGLSDRHPDCRNVLRNAAVETIRRHGGTIMPKLLPFLENLSDKTPSGPEYDNQRQGLVVLLGTLAQYIDSSEKVIGIVNRLMEELSTPSQNVQESVSKCLAPLVPKIAQEAKDWVGKLQYKLFEGDTYGERRGAAYGIAGLIKGMGIIVFKDIDLLPSIHTNLADKKNPKHREGGLLALEILCSTIGKLFEPYILKALPSLLIAFGDSDSNVRQAAEDTARAMMASMTVYGTKLILPSLIVAIDDESWRTKCAATELLGSMAFCAPKQLSTCLPNIVPKLIEVLADSSSKVQKSGEKALQQIARVVRNPEILGVTNQLMAGILDPVTKTSLALQSVLNTKFIHYVDAPSLALIMPVVRRAFEDRNSETRRVAAQIISNIYSLTEDKDMEPYLLHMVPGLQRSLLDPVPEIRTVSARALGAVVSKSGGATSEKLRRQVVPWLKEKLISPQSTVDRSGAAQGLCEVLAGAGTEQLEFVMPEIIAATENPEVPAETRDGYILMYIYLPMVFGDRFVPYLPQVVPPILKALADENEYVRSSALKAGQRLISQYCSHARKLLLPQLQLALMDENWRIRHASVQLIGDFLFNISGISGKSTSSTADEDDTMGMEQAGKTIIRALGQKDRDRVLAGLYLARSDVALIVRQGAGHVWKMVVANTPRTLKEITKVLFEFVVDSLASSCEERQQMGARCLGELVRKMGEKVINEILPVLNINQTSDDVSKRVGVAIALHEIIGNMSKEVTNHYLASIVEPVRVAICDDSEMVREAAADTFTVLYRVVGNDALDEIITPLLEQLTPEKEHILAGLCDVMKQNSKSMLPYLLPKLTKPPVNVLALCSLAAVSGDSLSRQLPKVLDALLAACETNDENDVMIESCEKVVTAVTDEDGVPVLVDYLIKRAGNDNNVPAAVLLNTFVSKSGVDLSDLAEDVLPGILNLYLNENSQIIDHAIGAAISMTQSMDQRELLSALPAAKKAINIVVSSAKKGQIAGFAHPKSLQPLVGMIRENILHGSTEMKELAAETLGMIVKVSTEVALKSHAVNLTGPLIRVLGDRYPANVKLPIIETLSKLLDKVGVLLKAFLPQLQSTFLKALQDQTSPAVRLAAGGALARLLKLHSKPEGTVIELLKLVSSSQDQQLVESSLATARAFVSSFSSKLSQQTVEEIYRVAEIIYSPKLDNPTEIDQSLTACSGALIGETVAQREDWSKAESLILADIESASTSQRTRQAKGAALQQLCKTNAEGLWTSEANSSVRTALIAAFGASDPVVACYAIRASAYILKIDVDRDILSAVARLLNNSSLDVRKAAATTLGYVGIHHDLSTDFLKLVVPQLINGCKESNSAVRFASELALIHLLKMKNNEEKFEAYHSTLEGFLQKNLDAVRVNLARTVKNGDLELESLENIVSVV